ncbi:MAG: NusA-like transcription termination signal-binding factor [Thaumarchaeota archaeon]|nr:NusA-like transcription termination signal-binding factor [Nitrososphaerota archaeon]
MPETIKLTSEELRLMQLFQHITRATARDCVIDPKMDRVIFIVNKGEMGLAIGRNGVNVKNLQKIVGKPLDLVEYSEDAKEFIRNSLNARFVSEIRLTEKLDGTKIAVVVVDQKQKGAVVGRDGRNAEKARLLAKRYFQISNIHIVSPT